MSGTLRRLADTSAPGDIRRGENHPWNAACNAVSTGGHRDLHVVSRETTQPVDNFCG